MRTLTKLLSTAFTLGAFALHAQAETIVIDNARVVTATSAGVLESADVLVVDGTIESVASNITAPAGARVIDAKGAWLTPGLFDSSTQIGLGDVSSWAVRSDHRVAGTDLGAGFRVSLAIDRKSLHIPIVRAEGVTRAIVRPSASDEIFAGQAATIALAEDNVMVDGSSAVFVYLGENGRRMAAGSRGKAMLDLLDSLDEAEFYARNKRAYDSNRLRPLRQSEHDLEALIPVIENGKPLAVLLDRESDIELLLEETANRDLNLVIIGGREAWKVADQVAARDIPVIIDVMDNLPGTFDETGVRLDNAALLADAGVRIAFMTDDLFGDNRTLTQQAGVAVANGLDWNAAVAAITSAPAVIWGIDDSYGSIAVGKDADLVLWDGDPLEVTSAPTMMLIRGVETSLSNRTLRLRDRYSNLDNPKEVPFGYRATSE